MAEPSQTEILKTFYDLLLKDEEFKKSLGRSTTAFLLATIGIAAVELTLGIPVITLATTPIAGALVAYLIEQVRSWIISGRPKVIFYFCAGCKDFRPVLWSEISRLRKIKSCGKCGNQFITRCQQNRHFLVSPKFDDPIHKPDVYGFCQFCDPQLASDVRYLVPKNLQPAKDEAVASEVTSSDPLDWLDALKEPE